MNRGQTNKEQTKNHTWTSRLLDQIVPMGQFDEKLKAKHYHAFIMRLYLIKKFSLVVTLSLSCFLFNIEMKSNLFVCYPIQFKALWSCINTQTRPWLKNRFKKLANVFSQIIYFTLTRRYGPLRGPSSSSCFSLWLRLFFPFRQKKSLISCFGLH